MKLIMKFSVPLLIGNLFQQVYSLVDSIVVGRHLGANALGGVGSVGMISFLFFSLCNGMASGIGVVISRYFGAKKRRAGKKSHSKCIVCHIGGWRTHEYTGILFCGAYYKANEDPCRDI